MARLVLGLAGVSDRGAELDEFWTPAVMAGLLRKRRRQIEIGRRLDRVVQAGRLGAPLLQPLAELDGHN
jgi:hypothetical protein